MVQQHYIEDRYLIAANICKGLAVFGLIMLAIAGTVSWFFLP